MIIDGNARTVWNGDRDKFRATLIAPSRFHRILFPIFAFNYEISRIAFQSSEPALAEIKFKWWQEELTSIKNNKLINKHEILDSLSEIIVSNNIPIELFIAIIKARRFDIYKDPHNSFEEQVDYIKQIFSSLFEICLRASSKTVSQNSIICVRDYGYALGVANLLIALPALISVGKNPLYMENHEGRTLTSSGSFRSSYKYESIKKIAQSGLRSLFDGRSRLKVCDSTFRPILFSACTINSTLDKVLKNPKLVAQNKVRPSPIYKGVRLLMIKLGLPI